MKTMRKEIKRLNEIITKSCLGGKAQVSDKRENDLRGPQFKQGRHPSFKHGLGHTIGAKTNGRKIINGYECVKFESKGKIGVERPAQIVSVQRPQAVVPHSGNTTVKGGNVTPHKNGKATNFVPDQTKPGKKVIYKEKKISQKPKELI